MNFVFIGLSISSSWGNGHATTYRSLIRALNERGHCCLFLEQDQRWYAENRDLPSPEFCEIGYYADFEQLQRNFAQPIRDADCVVLGSYVACGIRVGEWMLETAEGVRAFYDIDTPITIGQMRDGNCDYINEALVPRFELYLSFSGGPVLTELEEQYGARKAVALYCSADPALYRQGSVEKQWSLGFLGTYSDDRQPALERLLCRPARALSQQLFAVMGPMYPQSIEWPPNVERREHLDPEHHADFYQAQRFTLNLTRTAMLRAGYSPSVRLFEAASCGVPIITDAWEGLETFFTPGEEILVAETSEDVVHFLQDIKEGERSEIARRARQRFLCDHAPNRRAAELEKWIDLARESAIPPKARALEVER